MRKTSLDESPVGIKIARRNINNLRYADDTTLMAESEEELKSLLMRVKEESAKVGLKLNIKKTKIMASSSHTSWQIDGEEMEIKKQGHTNMRTVCWILAGFYVLTCCRSEGGLDFPTYDGKDRVIDLSEKNYKQTLKKYDMFGVLLHESVTSDKTSQRRFQMTEMVLEVAFKAKSLHSLPMSYDTQFKAFVPVYKALNDSGPRTAFPTINHSEIYNPPRRFRL
ncbi:Calsequestrin-2 [Varanus komodoensis]|nr:Calsequestrin-2 [Varanus komodoensis]